MLPLFPLGDVLFPGQPMPLCALEDRQRRLVHDVMGSPGPARIGVVAIREGCETVADGVRALYDVGCVAEVRRAVERDDGRIVLVTAGTRRFRVAGLDRSRPYLRAEVDLLPEDAGHAAAAQRAAQATQEAFCAYMDALPGPGMPSPQSPVWPDDPVELSYLLASLIVADLPIRQSLLAEPDALSRLDAERRLLSWEMAVQRKCPSTPMPDFFHSSYSRN
jgi:hypothetical protein